MVSYLLSSGALGLWLDSTFKSLDLSIFEAFGNIQSDFLTELSKIFTAFGNVKFIVLMGILGVLLLFFKRTRRYGIAMILVIAAGALVCNLILKPAAMRIRPYVTLSDLDNFMSWYNGAGAITESDFCFPSGHTESAFGLATVLCLLHIKDKKGYAAWVFPLIAALTGLSRIYLMVHYSTDVFAGAITGIILGIIMYFVSSPILKKIEASTLGERLSIGDRTFTGKKSFTPAKVALAFFLAVLVSFLAGYLF